MNMDETAAIITRSHLHNRHTSQQWTPFHNNNDFHHRFATINSRTVYFMQGIFFATEQELD